MDLTHWFFAFAFGRLHRFALLSAFAAKSAIADPTPIVKISTFAVISVRCPYPQHLV
jgi:hypothetical protein